MNELNTNSNSWNEWSKYVLKELERLNTCYRDLDSKMDSLSDKFIDKNEKLNARITTLQVKVVGIAAGTTILTSLVFLLLTHFLKGPAIP